MNKLLVFLSPLAILPIAVLSIGLGMDSMIAVVLLAVYVITLFKSLIK